MTNNWLIFSALFLSGALMGIAYFWLLWISVKKFSEKSQSVVQSVIGFILRLAAVGISLFFVAKWFQIKGIAFYLLGFFLMKKMIQMKIQKKKNYGYHN